MEIKIDKAFDIKSLNRYNLSLKIGHDFFIADVFKSKSGVHLAVSEQSFARELKDEFQTESFINALKSCPVKISKKYGSVCISFASTAFSITPKALFDKNLTANYIGLNTKIEGQFDYKYQVLDQAGIVICYTIPKGLNNWIKKIFPNAKITHEMAVVIQSVLRDFYSVSEDRLILNINKGYFDLIHVKKGKLNFANSFLFNEKEDLLYYILFTCEQLGIDQHEIEMYLLGEIKKGSEEHQLLFQYIKNIYFGSRNKNIKLAEELNTIPNHYFYSVFNQNLCV